MRGHFRNLSRSGANALIYVTVGVLMLSWSVVWYAYFLRPLGNPSPWQSYICSGATLSGLTMTVIGLMFGWIGRGDKIDDDLGGEVATTPVIAAPLVASNSMMPNVEIRHHVMNSSSRSSTLVGPATAAKRI